MAAKFGTSGLRGLVEDITDGTCERHVRAFLKYLISRNWAKLGDKIYIGKDFRPSSPQIAQQTAIAAIKEGFVPVDCGYIPTPALAYYAMGQNAASIMITGSHIPADRNGIKFYRHDGEIDKTDEVNISKFAADIDIHDKTDIVPSEVADETEAAINNFVTRFKSVFPDNILNGKRIGVYEHSSVARDILKDLLESLGAQIVSLGRSETFIPVDTEAVSDETVENLAIWTKEHQLNAIVSTDGDADRPLLSGEDGKYIKGDVLGFIASQFLEADTIATPISSNSGIKDTSHVTVMKTRVGSPYVVAAMNEAIDQDKKAVVGFEANGGFLLGSTFELEHGTLEALPTRDCILPILAVLAQAEKQNTSIVDLVTAQKLPVTYAGRLQNFPTETGQALVKLLTDNKEERESFFKAYGHITEVNLTDGLRVTMDNGQIIHLRPSGNAPEMRCYVEAETIEAAEALVEKVITQIQISADR